MDLFVILSLGVSSVMVNLVKAGYIQQPLGLPLIPQVFISSKDLKS